MTVFDLATMEFEEMLASVTADGQPQPLREGIHAGHANPVQSTGNLVAVLVELAACVQHTHHDFCCGTLGFVLVIELDADRNTTAIVGDCD